MWKFNYVFVTTNLITKKQYIGDHSTNNINDNYLGSGVLFLRAIKKYGKENFELKILEECNSKQQAFNLQEKYITEYNTLIPFGYNISPRGGHNVQNCISELTKKKISESKTGQKQSDETRQKRSDTMQKNGSKKGKKHHMYGKKLSFEHKKALITSRIGISNVYSDESKKKMSDSAKNRKSPTNAKPFSKQEIKIIDDNNKLGLSYYKIALILGVHRGRVQRYLHKSKLKNI